MKKVKPNKKQLLEMKKQNFEKYTISGLWITMCGYIALMFVKEVMTNHYLIHLYVDSLVAVFAFYIALHNLMTQYHLIDMYKTSKKPFIFQVAGLVIGLFIAIISAKSPFDISFLILVIAYLTGKKMFEKELNI